MKTAESGHLYAQYILGLNYELGNNKTNVQTHHSGWILS
jgi:hypothetical protein